jgi:hypothetical protein
LVFDRCCIVDMGHLLGGDYTMSVKNGVARTDTEDPSRDLPEYQRALRR